MDSESSFVRHEPCPNCGSSDAHGLYSDGHRYCFACETYTKGDGSVSEPSQSKPKTDLIPLSRIAHDPIQSRRIVEETTKHFRYGVSSYNGKPCQVATYFDDQQRPVCQKLRFKDKEFKLLGDTSKLPLYGRWLCRDGGKMLVVTEGEIDALSVAQAQGLKWPAVSVPNGASSAAKIFKQNLEWLERFEKVVIMFDMDEPGREAAKACAEVLSPGKAYIATLPLKDPNEMLKARKKTELVDAIWSAKEFRPDGIVNSKDIWEDFSEEDEEGIPYPYPGLNVKTLGIRKGELVTFTAGSGIGKSSACREIAHHLISQGYRVGYIALEESIKRTLRGLVGIELSKPIHLGIGDVPKDELKAAFDKVTQNDRLFLYDHFGSINSDNLLNKIRYMASGLDVDFVFLDHLSIVVSGDTEIDDERRAIDVTMTKLRSLVEETGVGMVLVSHLKRPPGKGHEEGAKTSLAQLRGSAAIAQLSDIVLGMERNQQDPKNADLTTIRVLKNRYTGETGESCVLRYDKPSGRLKEDTKSPFSCLETAGSDDNDF